MENLEQKHSETPPAVAPEGASAEIAVTEDALTGLLQLAKGFGRPLPLSFLLQYVSLSTGRKLNLDAALKGMAPVHTAEPSANSGPKEPLSIRINPDSRAALQKLSAKENRSVSVLVDTAVHEFLARRNVK